MTDGRNQPPSLSLPASLHMGLARIHELNSVRKKFRRPKAAFPLG